MDPLSDVKGPETVEIYTFGRFLVCRGGKTLSQSSVRSVKVWLLFQYLLTHRKKAIPPETILDALYPGQPYSDPNRILRSQVFRLRRLLAGELGAPQLAENITFAHGCYRWGDCRDCRLDTEEFENLIAGAEAFREASPEKAIAALKKAEKLYLGDYLPGCSCEEWVQPARNYYRSLYTKNMILLAELLLKAGRFAEAAAVCRDAMEIDYFEEKLHLCYLEALIEEGQYAPAREHYKAITASFYCELGVKPSAAMRRLYGRIRFVEDEIFNLNLPLLQERLNDRDSAAGAFLCEPELFRYIYQLERLRQERSGQSACLALLALTGPSYRIPPRELLRRAMETLLHVLRTNLRKGDIICRSHEAQYLLILPNIGQAGSSQVLKRIEKVFQQSFTGTDLVLHQKRQVLLSQTPPLFVRKKGEDFFYPLM